MTHIPFFPGAVENRKLRIVRTALPLLRFVFGWKLPIWAISATATATLVAVATVNDYTGIYFLQWYGTAYHFYCLDPAQMGKDITRSGTPVFGLGTCAVRSVVVARNLLWRERDAGYRSLRRSA